MAWSGNRTFNMRWDEMISIVILHLMASKGIGFGYRGYSVINRCGLFGEKRLAVFPWKIVDIKMEMDIELQRIENTDKEISQKILEFGFKNRLLELERRRVDIENRRTELEVIRSKFEERKLDRALKNNLIVGCIISFALICMGLLIGWGLDSLRSIAIEILGKIGNCWNKEFRGKLFYLTGGLFSFASSVIRGILFGIYFRARKLTMAS